MGRAFALVLAWLGLIGCFSLPYRDVMAPESGEPANAVVAGRGDVPPAVDEQPVAEQHNGRANEARKLAAQRRDLETEPDVSGDAMVTHAAPVMSKIVILSSKVDVSPSSSLDRPAEPATSLERIEKDRTKARVVASTVRAAPLPGIAEPAATRSKPVRRQATAATKSRKSPAATEVGEARPAGGLKIVTADAKPVKVSPPLMRLTSVGDAAATVAMPKARKDGHKAVLKHAPPPPVIAAIDQAAADKMRRKSWKQDVRARDIALYKPDGI